MIERVDRLQRVGDRVGLARFDLVLTGIVVALLVLTAVMAADPQVNRVIVDRTLDVSLASLSLVASGVLAALAMLRYRESARVSTLLQASAFVTLAIYNAVAVFLVLTKLDGRFGLTLGLPEQLPLYVSATTWLTVAGVLVASGLSARRNAHGRTAHARWLVLAPSLVIVAM